MTTDTLRKLVWLAPLIIPVGLTLIAFTSLVLVLFGVFSGILALLIAGPLTTVAGKHLLKLAPKNITNTHMLIDILMLLVAGLWFAYALNHSAQHLFIDRDPGFYANTGVWLSTENSLDFDFVNAFGDEYARLGSPGFNEYQGGQYVQGTHILPSTLGFFGQFFGVTFSLQAVAVISASALLGFYSFSRTLVERKWALLGSVVLASTLPFLYFGKDTYSETLSLTALFAGLAVFTMLLQQKKATTAQWAIASVLMMISVLARIDGIMIAAATSFVCLLLLSSEVGLRHRIGLWMMHLGSLLGVAILWIDVYFFSPVYYKGHYDKMFQLLALLVALNIIGFIFMLGIKYLKWFRNLVALTFERRNELIKLVLVLFVVIFLVLLSRPIWYVEEFGDANPVVKSLQIEEGVAVEPMRKYSELTLQWLGQYLGPGMAVASFIGSLLIIAKGLKKEEYSYMPFAIIFFLVASAYIWRQAITPDQIWAMRRFTPMIIPGLVFLGVFAISHAATMLRFEQLPGREKLIAFTLLASLLILPNIVYAKPFVTLSAHRHASSVQALCDELSNAENPAVLYIGLAANLYAHATRTYCGIEASNMILGPNPITQARLQEAFTIARNNGYEPYLGVIGAELGKVDAFLSEETPYTAVAINFQDIKRTLTIAPSKRTNPRWTLLVFDSSDIEGGAILEQAN